MLLARVVLGHPVVEMVELFTHGAFLDSSVAETSNG
jgi:hypothetical protein